MNRHLVILAAGALAAALLLAAGLFFVFYNSCPDIPVLPRRAESAVSKSPAPSVAAVRTAASDTEMDQHALLHDKPADTRILDAEELLSENRRLAAMNRKLQNQLIEVLNWILLNFKGKYPLAEKNLAKLRLDPVTADSRLNGDVAEFLNITAEEEAMINDALSYARAIVQEIQDDNTTLTAPSADKVIVRIPAFPEEGALIREDLCAALEITLGADRFDRFMDVSNEGLETHFDHFGNAARTLIFELVYAGRNEPPLLTIKDGWVIQEEDGRKVIQATESTVEALPEEYADYADVLPGGVQFPVE
ncbi:MAG: hypothetical protein JXB04_13370 [Kiritimatiellae bacterium]|nr:hypothetical protein [Kiritimatiellia bacterium]